MNAACFLLLMLPPIVSAQTLHWGRCPQPKVQADFDVQQYMGRWYAIEQLPALFSPGKCHRGNYTLNEDGTIELMTSQFYLNRKWVVGGKCAIPDKEEPAKLSMHFFNLSPLTSYWVLSTDYHSYSVVYSCTGVYSLFHLDYGWIFSRSTTLDPELVRRGRELFEKEGIDISKMSAVEQDCDEEEQGSFTFTESGISAS